MKRFSAHVLVSALVLTACPDGGKDTESTGDASTGGASTSTGGGSSGTTDTPTTDPPTSTTTPTTNEPTTDPTTATTTDPTATDPTTETMGSTTDPTTATEGSSSTGGGLGVCGDGVIDDGEACDDSNIETEISMTKMPPLMYEATACIDDCSLVLALCGNGTVDAGEACDDGNKDSYDDCTTSCAVNDKGYHAPCKRMCNKSCDTDVSSGTFTGCDNVEVPPGAAGVCYVSTKFALAPRHFAEGECSVTAQTCSGGILCPPNIGDYDTLTTCPAGTTLIDRTTMAAGITVKTKTCQLVCETDADCRWNSFDAVWSGSGQFRCQTTADSNNVKICADAQN